MIGIELMKFKLPPRFKIFHNVSEDYYFIKERFCFFWYLREKTGRELQSFIWRKQKMKIESLPQHVTKYDTLEEAKSKINFLLEWEKQSNTPDEIKLVKEYDI